MIQYDDIDRIFDDLNNVRAKIKSFTEKKILTFCDDIRNKICFKNHKTKIFKILS